MEDKEDNEDIARKGVISRACSPIRGAPIPERKLGFATLTMGGCEVPPRALGQGTSVCDAIDHMHVFLRKFENF